MQFETFRDDRDIEPWLWIMLDLSSMVPSPLNMLSRASGLF
jgi:hypothetical protein